jgi:hypothetical protein
MSKKKLFIFVLYTLGILFVASYLFGTRSDSSLIREMSGSSKYAGADMAMTSLSLPSPGRGGTMNVAPENRMSTLDTSISIYVKDVAPVMKEVQDTSNKLGGFIVSKNESRPTEGGSGYISVRIPRENKDEFLSFVRNRALTVLSVTESGQDITAQYYDAESRIQNLEETMRLLRDSQSKATTPKDIADIAIQMNQIQEQIDFARGQAEYLKEASATVLVTVDIQTDEYALPYSPQDGWSPEKVFKTAVRSLTLFLRFVGSAVIWLVVYAPVIIIGFALIYLTSKAFDKVANKYKNKD